MTQNLKLKNWGQQTTIYNNDDNSTERMMENSGHDILMNSQINFNKCKSLADILERRARMATAETNCINKQYIKYYI